MVVLKGWRDLQRALGLKSSHKIKTQKANRLSMSQSEGGMRGVNATVSLKGEEPVRHRRSMINDDNTTDSDVSTSSTTSTDDEISADELSIEYIQPLASHKIIKGGEQVHRVEALTKGGVVSTEMEKTHGNIQSSSSDGTISAEQTRSDREGLRIYRIASKSSESKRRKSEKATRDVATSRLQTSKSIPSTQREVEAHPVAAARPFLPTTRLQFATAQKDKIITSDKKRPVDRAQSHVYANTVGANVSADRRKLSQHATQVIKHTPPRNTGAELKRSSSTPTGQNLPLHTNRNTKNDRFFPATASPKTNGISHNLDSTQRQFDVGKPPSVIKRPLSSSFTRASTSHISTPEVKPRLQPKPRFGRSLSSGAVEDLSSLKRQSTPSGHNGGLNMFKSVGTPVLAPSPRQAQQDSKSALKIIPASNKKKLRHSYLTGSTPDVIPERTGWSGPSDMLPKSPYPQLARKDSLIASPMTHLRRGVQMDMISAHRSPGSLGRTHTGNGGTISNQTRGPLLSRSMSSGARPDLPWATPGRVSRHASQQSQQSQRSHQSLQSQRSYQSLQSQYTAQAQRSPQPLQAQYAQRSQNSQKSQFLQATGMQNRSNRSKKRVQFSKHTDIVPTYPNDIYDRDAMKLCDLSPAVYHELMSYKIDEMMVHRASTQNTNWHLHNVTGDRRANLIKMITEMLQVPRPLKV